MERLVIYRITNTKTGLSYIGQTRRGFAVRRGQHLSRTANVHRDSRLYRALRADPEAFAFEIICHALAPEYLDDLERHFIAEFDTFENGYNSTDGGKTLAPEARAKISRANKGRSAPWARTVWDRRRENGTDKMDMSKHVPSGERNVKAKCYVVAEPGGRLLAVAGMNAFCKANGLDFKTMIDTLKGVQRHHKGYVLHQVLSAQQKDLVALNQETLRPLCVAQGPECRSTTAAG